MQRRFLTEISVVEIVSERCCHQAETTWRFGNDPKGPTKVSALVLFVSNSPTSRSLSSARSQNTPFLSLPLFLLSLSLFLLPLPLPLQHDLSLLPHFLQLLPQKAQLLHHPLRCVPQRRHHGCPPTIFLGEVPQCHSQPMRLFVRRGRLSSGLLLKFLAQAPNQLV